MKTYTPPLLMAPGPIRIPDIIKSSMMHDPPYFTSTEFSSLLARIQPMLKEVFGTNEPVLIGTGSGSCGMEAAVSNFFNTDEKVVVIKTGKYGMNWVKMTAVYGLDTHIVQVPTGHSPSIKHVVDVVKETNPAGLFITHTETTTGVLNEIYEITSRVKSISPNTLIIVDAVSSLLTEHFVARDYDVVISASQKALSLPPGLFFMTVSEDAYIKAETSIIPRFYFNVLEERTRTIKNITTFTPASYLVKALEIALNMVLAIGKHNLIESTKEKAAEVRDFLRPMFQFVSKSPCNAVTACYSQNARSNEFISRLKDKGVIVGAGLGNLNNEAFRIMHFGWDLRDDEIERTLKAIGDTYHE